MWSMFLLSVSVSEASPVVVVVDPDHHLTPQQAERAARRAVRGAAVVSDSDAVSADLLRSHARECSVALDARSADALGRVEGSKVYVAMPQSGKARDLALWRFDTTSRELILAHNAATTATRAGHAEIVFLGWPQVDSAERSMTEAALLASHESFHVDRADAPWRAELTEALADNRFACSTPLPSEARAALSARAREGSLFVALGERNGRDASVWRIHERGDATLLR